MMRYSTTGMISVKMTVRRLRSIRRSSMPSMVGLKPPSAGTLRAEVSMV